MTEAPAFDIPVTTIANETLICLSIKILDENNLVVSCFVNQSSQQKNIFQIVNRTGAIS